MSQAWKGCPGDLSADWRKVWDIAHKDVSERGWRDAYHPTLERYVRNLKASADALDQVKRDGQVVSGARDQLVVHPAWKIHVEASRIADKAAADLLLTPAARARLNEVAKPPGGKFGDALG